MRFSVLSEFFGGFAILDDFIFGFAVSSTPQCPPHHMLLSTGVYTAFLHYLQQQYNTKR